MAARERPRDFFSQAEIAGLIAVSPWHTTWLILHCWASILLIWAACILWTNPLTVLLGVMLIGARQLGLAVLNHDGAHNLLYKNRRLNDWVSEWVLNRPLLGASVVAYRNYHVEHHKHTQQADDPDLHLSAPFPISRDSFKRKMIRDLTGQTGWKQRSATVKGAFGRPDQPWSQRLSRGLRRMGPNLVINLIFLAGFVAAGHWYLYFLLWVLPALTWEPFITRVRNIGEHGAVPDNDDRLRNTRTTYAGLLERAFIAPYFVNYHLEHHLLVSCPCYRLRRTHALLLTKGFGARMELKPNYLAMLRHATTPAGPGLA
jgi:fatty acid desaturase